MSKLRFVSNLISGEVSERMLGGRAYLVAPVVALVEGVVNEELAPADEIGEFPAAWNGVPVTINHPVGARGENLSARNSPELHAEIEVGKFWNVRFDPPKLKGEVWLDVEKTQVRAAEVVARLRDGDVLEVSTGYWRVLDPQEGVFNGKPYVGIQRGLRPDHLAILPDAVGACSITDGCGFPRANEGAMVVNIRSTARKPHYSGTEELSWADVGKDFEDFRAAYYAAHGGSPDELPEQVQDAPAEMKSWIAAKTLLGDAGAEDFRNLAFFPVVNPVTGKLNAGALRAVLSGRGSQADIPQAALESAQTMARRLLEDEFSDEQNNLARVVRNWLLKLLHLGEDQMTEREKLIAELAENGDCPLTAEILDLLEDEHLQTLKARMEDREQDTEQTSEQLDALAEVVNEFGLSVDEAAEIVRNHYEAAKQAREDKIEAVLANEALDFERVDLEHLTDAALEKLAAFVPKEPQADYSGRGGLRSQATQNEDENVVPAAPAVLLAKVNSEE